MSINQNAEQIARDKIDRQLTACGWAVQKKTEINLSAGVGVAVREYITDAGVADYILFVEKKWSSPRLMDIKLSQYLM